jgi:hypothetical protein
MTVTPQEVLHVISSPWVTCDDLEELIVRIENENGAADPMIEQLLILEGDLVLKGAG